MKVQAINQLSDAGAERLFTRCCASTAWVRRMLASRPFADTDSLFQLADEHWNNLTESDCLQAFAGHPQIGDLNSLREKFSDTRIWAGGEQAGINSATEATLRALAAGNKAYREKFGFIFIVCATGKSAAEMLQLLRQRLQNDRDTELKNAAAEQRKITRIRLEKL